MLKKRIFEKEQLDNLNLKGDKLTNTLDGLSLINKFLGNTNGTFKAVKKEILKSDIPLKIIDLGCGGGDNLRKIAIWCFDKNIEIELIGIDGNQNILDYAQTKSPPNCKITYIQDNILVDSFDLPNCDILISSHFIYHFDDEKLVNFLNKNKHSIKNSIFFSELERSSLSYILFKVFNVFLPFSKMVKEDGLQAIRRAFKKEEITSILSKCSIKSYLIKRIWAFRFLIKIDV